MFPDEITSYAAFESRYSNKSYIGSGGFSKVYKVFDHAKNHYVALKMADVRPEWKQFTLQREVELVNSLPSHRNIARYENCYRFNTGMTGQVDFAILRFYEYGNLEQFLSKKKDLTLADKRGIIRGMLEGIAFLHGNGIIHRDLKSQNILLHREDGVWTPKITDFGLSRQTSGNSNVTNSAVGLSYAYAAPEQIQNRKIYKNVDLWAAGVIIYRIMAGELPFQSETGGNSRSTQSQLQISQKIINLELPLKLSDLPEPYLSMIRQCLVLDPQQRVERAEDLINMMRGESYEPSKTDTPTSEADEQTQLIREELEARNPSASQYPTPEELPHFSPAYEEELAEIEYEAPRHNPTQFIVAHPQAEERPSPPSEVAKGGENKVFRWWLIVLPILLVAIAAGIYYLSEKSQEENVQWELEIVKSEENSYNDENEAAQSESVEDSKEE